MFAANFPTLVPPNFCTIHSAELELSWRKGDKARGAQLYPVIGISDPIFPPIEGEVGKRGEKWEDKDAYIIVRMCYAGARMQKSFRPIGAAGHKGRE